MQDKYDVTGGRSLQDMNNIGIDGNVTDLGCPEDNSEFISQFGYWVDGVVLCCLAVPGLLMNIRAMFVLSTHKSMRNSFNDLLISLAAFDSIYILTAMLNQSILKQFNVKSLIVIYPQFLHPLRSISFAASIFMTVVIAHERHRAIKRPIDFSYTMQNQNAGRLYVLKYTFFVIVCAILFNIPKFLEVGVYWGKLER